MLCRIIWGYVGLCRMNNGKENRNYDSIWGCSGPSGLYVGLCGTYAGRTFLHLQYWETVPGGGEGGWRQYPKYPPDFFQR